MKKAIFAIIALVIAAAVSVGAFLAVRSKSNKENKNSIEKQENNVLFNVNSDDINKFIITTQGETFTIEHNGDYWEVTDCPGESFTPNENKCIAMRTYIANLIAYDMIGELTDENAATYGLDDPYIIRFFTDSEDHTLYVGDASQTGQYYYVYTDKKKEIYLAEESSIGYLLADPLDLKTDELLPYSDNDIVGIEVYRNGKQAYKLTYDTEDHMWKLPDKYKMLTVNQTRPSAIVTLSTRLSAETMYPQSDKDIATYGFDKPDAEVIYTAADGTRRDILLRYFGKDAQTYIHAYTKEDAQVAAYYTADFSFVNYRIVDLVLPTIECGNMYAVTDVSLKTALVSEEIVMDPTNNRVTCSGTELDLTNAELKSFYENFYNTFAYISISEVDVEAEPELKDPIMSTSFTRLEGKTTKFDLVDAGDGLAYIFVNGKYAGTMTDTEFLSEGGAMQSAYDMLCRHSDLTPQEKTETPENTEATETTETTSAQE